MDLLLRLDESIEIFLEFQLIANATVNEELKFALSVGFTNDGKKVPSQGKVKLGSTTVEIFSSVFLLFLFFLEGTERYFTDDSIQPNAFVTPNFLPIVTDLELTSSRFTGGRALAINEIFLVRCDVLIPYGAYDIKVIAGTSINIACNYEVKFNFTPQV